MYIHPGRAFLEQHGSVEGPEDVRRYVDFLRERSRIGHEPPVDLSRVFLTFDIPTPERVPLAGQQGIVVNSELGIILIEERDRELRQRFSEAHELMELLFGALPRNADGDVRSAGAFKYHAKERLCNEGAAELLMPEASFLPRVKEKGLCFETGRELARDYEVSLSAALVRMIRLGPGRHAVVLWKMKNKPVELKSQVPSGQLPLLNITQERTAPKKLRVEWAFGGPDAGHIPTSKSVPEDASIYVAWRDNRFTRDEHWLDLGSIRGTFRCENLPFALEDETLVLSLLHLPNDVGCPSCRH